MTEAPAKIDRGFAEVRNSDGSMSVSYKTDGMGWIARIVLVLPFWLVISLLFVTAGGTENVVLFYPITFGLTLLAIYLFTFGKTKEFKIYPNGFSVDGRRYEFGGVKGIFLDNPADKSGPVTSKPIGFIDGGSGVLETMAAMLRSRRQLWSALSPGCKVRHMRVILPGGSGLDLGVAPRMLVSSGM
ncbi:hypothetical protein ACDP63_09830 [Paracoccus sp. P2]|uniref:Uncharacterized protein n=1 Tax=Paracoccus pantotrophus TaxID=82367 RepID=A0A7H9BWE2_PARPN|nr:hypothetical protein [Paracoccus pantotrophus]MDF3855369.1 hypothetical protein [Paracoccus pantotrophus]QLH14151.1 hypothetical protein HYQ43_07900 [Paracoccus pantotrophus]RDD92212.1 hypothetical protein DTW92_20645 [Paracoccus pantotrophus]RNI17819.1 hypothetical protein EB844_08860 [Paracoccus pantotrophus]WGR67639.1 hypothetical protein E3U24_20805 [Paracoccus pantotrophus]